MAKFTDDEFKYLKKLYLLHGTNYWYSDEYFDIILESIPKYIKYHPKNFSKRFTEKFIALVEEKL